MSKFLSWLGENVTVVMITKQVVADTLTCWIFTVSDVNLQLKTFVVVEKDMVSYDSGFYEVFDKNSEVKKVINKLFDSYNNW